MTLNYIYVFQMLCACGFVMVVSGFLEETYKIILYIKILWNFLNFLSFFFNKFVVIILFFTIEDNLR